MSGAGGARQGILSLVVRTRPLPATRTCRTSVFCPAGDLRRRPRRRYLHRRRGLPLLLTLPDSSERLPVAGKVCWVPTGAARPADRRAVRGPPKANRCGARSRPCWYPQRRQWKPRRVMTPPPRALTFRTKCGQPRGLASRARAVVPARARSGGTCRQIPWPAAPNPLPGHSSYSDMPDPDPWHEPIPRSLFPFIPSVHLATILPSNGPQSIPSGCSSIPSFHSRPIPLRSSFHIENHLLFHRCWFHRGLVDPAAPGDALRRGRSTASRTSCLQEQRTRLTRKPSVPATTGTGNLPSALQSRWPAARSVSGSQCRRGRDDLHQAASAPATGLK